MKMLIDVRSPDEFEEGHADGAINIPIEDIQSGELGPLEYTEKEIPIELYCRTGSRSGQAKDMLEELGFTEVKNLGGLDDVLGQ